MKLFLSGGGSDQESIELDKKFVQAINVTKPVLYIPIAIDTKKHPYPECLTWLKNNFKSLGFDDFVIWTENDLRGKTVKDFEKFGGVYIGGGNTFKLLKELKEFGTFEILKELAKKDVPIYGGSAGAIIWGPTITNAIGFDENYLELTDLSALGMTKEYEIWCHYSEPEKEKVREYMSKYSLEKVIAIPEDAGIIIEDEKLLAVGPNKVSVFTKNTERVYSPSELIS